MVDSQRLKRRSSLFATKSENVPYMEYLYRSIENYEKLYKNEAEKTSETTTETVKLPPNKQQYLHSLCKVREEYVKIKSEFLSAHEEYESVCKEFEKHLKTPVLDVDCFWMAKKN